MLCTIKRRSIANCSRMGEASLQKKIITLICFFVCGAFSSVLGNVLYNTNSIGLHNVNKPFVKPWFQTWSMFIAMSLLVFDTPFSRKCRCPKYTVDGPTRGWGLFRIVSVPALCDLFATVLQNVSLLYLPPSVWQMTRGSILLFTALFAIFYRHKKLHAPDWIGVVTTIVGITIVGAASIISPSSGTKFGTPVQMVIAMVLIVVAQGLQAFQTIVEEELLHDVDATENEIVSFEGLWGLYFSSFITLPIASILPENLGEGLFENSIETAVMIYNSFTIVLLVVGYMISILGYNLTGMYVTSFSTAIHRNIYEALRSMAVWALSVIVYYLFPKSGGGEPINILSLLQLAGFAVSICGSFIYNRVIKLPFLKYEEDELNNEPLIKE